MTPSGRRLRIWFVAERFHRPSEVWMLRQAVGLSEVADVLLVASEYLSPETWSLDHAVLPAKVQRSWNRKQSKLVNTATGGRAVLFRGSVNWWRRLHNEWNPDVVLVQFGSGLTSVLPFIRGTGATVVPHFHGRDLSADLADPVKRYRLRKGIGRSSRLVCVNDAQFEVLTRLGAAAGTVAVIPCGVPDEYIDSVDSDAGRHLGTSRCEFLLVGRLVEKKRPDLSIRAFGLCAAAFPNSFLRVIGDGPMLAECRALVSEMGLGEQVRFEGVATADAVLSALRSADVLVQHSVSASDGDAEGWPVSIAEACATGLPVVATRHAGIPSQVVSGVTGFLVDEHDWNSMGGRMIELARDATLRRRMGSAGRIHIAQYRVSNQVHRLHQLLLDAAEDGGCRA